MTHLEQDSKKIDPGCSGATKNRLDASFTPMKMCKKWEDQKTLQDCYSKASRCHKGRFVPKQPKIKFKEK